MNEKEFQEALNEAIKEAVDIAKNGTKSEKEDFVNWACSSINYLSSQFNEESKQSLKAIEAQYKAYLNALNK